MIKCDTLILDKDSISDTIPTNIVSNKDSTIEHEATVSKISDANLFYLQTKGIPKEKCEELILRQDFKEVDFDSIKNKYKVQQKIILSELEKLV